MAAMSKLVAIGRLIKVSETFTPVLGAGAGACLVVAYAGFVLM
jgi:hypothetical protein